jgi:tetratricopeptide (TPR) repeat protein
MEEAIDYLDSHTQAYPEQLVARFLFALLLLNDKQHERAKTEIEYVIANAEPRPMYFSSLALAYPDDIDARMRILERGLDTVPGDPMLAVYLAGDYELSGRVDEAIGILENVVAADPGMIIAANNLAGLLLDYRTDEQSHARALMLAENFAGTQNAALIDTLGWALYRTGNYDAAVAYLEAAVAAAADVPELHYHLGMVYMVLENDAGARQELDQAIQLAQTSGRDFTGIEDARAARQQLEES